MARVPNRLPIYPIGTPGVQDQINLEDNEAIVFGTGTDIRMFFDGTSLVYQNAAASTIATLTTGGALRGLSGSAAAPTFAFTVDSDTGIFRSAANTLGFATGGSLRILLSSTGQFQTGDGTVAAPVITFSIDADTGFYRVSANQMAAACGGVDCVRFRTAGSAVNFLDFTPGAASSPPVIRSSGADTNIGIHFLPKGNGQMVFPDGTAALPGIRFLGDTDTGIFLPATGQIGFSAGGTLALRVKNNRTESVVNGTAANPAYTFGTGQDLGMYRAGVDDLRLAVGGVDAAKFNTFGSAVNYFQFTPSSTGVEIKLEPAGTDTDIDIAIIPKGEGSLQRMGGLIIGRKPTATSITTAKGDYYIGVTSTAAARTITLESDAVASGRSITIKDESGAAGTNNITIATEGAETIDGNATEVISQDYGSRTLISDGTNWFIV